MPFTKSYTTPNGSQLGFHKIVRANVNVAEMTQTVEVHSWPSETAYLQGKGLAWSTTLTLPLPEDYVTGVTDAIMVEGPFSNAVEVPDAAETLEAAKLRKWAQIKVVRDGYEFGGFAHNGGTYDSDPISQSRIQGAALMAVLAAQAQQPFTIDWTLADNSVVTLDGAGMIGVGLALGLHVGTQHEIARQLRDAINAAQSAEDLGAIQWPTS